MTYTMTKNGATIIRDEDGACIPVDERNRDYQGYLAWLADGNTPNPYVPPPPVPQFISKRQFFQQAAVIGIVSKSEAIAAVQTGTIPTVLQNIVDAETNAGKRFAMEMLLSGATVFDRNHPMTAGMGAALGMTDAEIDQFFIEAASL